MTFEADTSEVDLKSGKSTSYNIVMKQGGWTLAADEGRLDYQRQGESGEWNLKGNVRLRGPGSEMDGDAAKVVLGAKRIRFVNFTGRPATFRHLLEQEGKIAEGHGESIQYDLENATASLVGDAFITMGRFEIANASILYDLKQQKVVADNPPPSTGKVRGRINQQVEPKESQ